MAAGQSGGDYLDTSEYPVGDTSLVYVPALDMTLARDKAEGLVEELDPEMSNVLIPLETER
jgi:hypothetical protein